MVETYLTILCQNGLKYLVFFTWSKVFSISNDLLNST